MMCFTRSSAMVLRRRMYTLELHVIDQHICLVIVPYHGRGGNLEFRVAFFTVWAFGTEAGQVKWTREAAVVFVFAFRAVFAEPSVVPIAVPGIRLRECHLILLLGSMWRYKHSGLLHSPFLVKNQHSGIFFRLYSCRNSHTSALTTRINLRSFFLQSPRNQCLQTIVFPRCVCLDSRCLCDNFP